MRIKKKINLVVLLAYFFVFINISAIHGEDLSFNFGNNIEKRVEVIPCGIIIGVKVDDDGKMVFDQKKTKYHEKDILPAKKIYPKNFISTANENNSQKKNDATIKNSAQGIGTMTYYNPMTNKFGALGHGITDLDTQKILSVKSGDIKKAINITLVKALCGDPGEILAEINNTEKLGNIKLNNEFGIYGFLDLIKIKNNIPTKKMPIGLKNEIHAGPAIILSNLENNNVRSYKINIENIDKFNCDATKNMTIKITDPNLLNKTNGIIQGMSGSPIIQDNKLIGAITHVFVHEPAKGYGIFIENMIKQEKFI